MSYRRAWLSVAVLANDNACLLSKNVTMKTMEQCSLVMNQSLSTVANPHDCVNDDNGTYSCDEPAKHYSETLLRDGDVIPIDADASHQVVVSQVCK